jgi:hypothetical protein
MTNHERAEIFALPTRRPFAHSPFRPRVLLAPLLELRDADLFFK